MAPAILPSSVNSVPLVHGNVFSTRSENLNRYNILRKSAKQALPSTKRVLPLVTSVFLFPQFRGGFSSGHKLTFRSVSASAPGLVVEQADSSATDTNLPATDAENVSNEDSTAKEAAAAAAKKRARPVRKSEMPPVKNEELIVGASFTGKVKSIQPFGAFIDFGAFTDGLVHVSQLSDSFVKEVASVVSVGQEVTVKLLEANMETGRISLTMREGDDNNKSQQSQDPSSSGDRGRPPRKGPPKSNQTKNEGRKSSKFVKGQDLDGTVKNLTRSGSFISLPDGEEGFLPTAEEIDEGLGSLMGAGSSLEVGQAVRVRVLRITRGQVTLTMKKEEDAGELDAKLKQGVVHKASNPFMLAFLQNKDIASFLDSREEEKKSTSQAADVLEGSVAQTEADIDDGTSTKEESVEAVIVEEVSNEISEAVEESTPNESIPSNEAPSVDVAEEKDVESDASETKPEPISLEILISEEESQAADSEENLEIPISSSPQTPESKASEEETQTADNEENPEIPISSSSQTLESEAKIEEDNLDIDGEKLPLEESAVAETSESETEIKSVISEEASNEELSEVPIPQESITEGETEAKVEEDNLDIDGEKLPLEESAVAETSVSETEIKSVISEQASIEELPEVPIPQESITEDNDAPANTVEIEQIEAVSNNTSLDSDGQNENPSTTESTVKAAIAPALVKQLREETGAGMMDCKKALSETEGDLIKAQEYLRKKGLASADKKASRKTAEGRIGSYIHDSRIGILVEVNCETDFVSRGEIFKELVDDLAMQAAACPQVQYLSSEDVPQEIVDKEREIEMQKEDLLSKPEQIRSKIVEGRIKKRLDELSLLEQPFIKNDKLIVKDLVKQMISTIGENIKVTRFIRYNLGEGLEKKSQDFAAEVAAQTSAKPAETTTPNEQPPVAVEAVDKAPTVAVSAALVKQLRDETGAGMMDCKKALAETEGNLEKAQEYLRKKGLSAADKKSSRIAAEGRIGSYIHDSRIGVLVEVNCETDFVGRSEKFKELVDDLAMQVVACPQVMYVSIEDIPESVIKREKELEMQREDLQTKPVNIREKIVEGRISKRLGELSLLEQPFIKDDSVLIKDLVKQTVAALGENIKVRRFVKFTLGETAGIAEDA
ncbi:polyprotein of EF-Ts, chloroplastic isoform X1 [Impatiens glandulifera]|uniref:polyprotein of EF-Ts, chloroplastic isoform X1 n=1 Tax=Impatiens glandulifera TaxID=253017 RepID=UPI001FB089A8|nr:polyprotein of EF-Ts, chloroplastic isoform X1 [Impatiens glandulifera]